jgi:hypothetical protein
VLSFFSAFEAAQGVNTFALQNPVFLRAQQRSLHVTAAAPNRRAAPHATAANRLDLQARHRAA